MLSLVFITVYFYPIIIIIIITIIYLAVYVAVVNPGAKCNLKHSNKSI